MSKRAYVFLDTENGASEQVAQALEGMPGVLMADPVDGGPPDVVVVVEGAEWSGLAERFLHVVTFVEAMTEEVRLLPCRQCQIREA